MHDVITVGSATCDLFAKTDPQESEIINITKNKKSEKLLSFPLGSKILIKEMTFDVGGGGTNAAVSLSRLGLRTAYIGKMGNDDNGKKVLELLAKEKVDFLGKVENGNTGFSVILDSVKDDRTLFTFKGLNDSLSFSDIEKDRLQASWFYFSSMTGDSYNALEELAEYAKKHRIKILFNPSMYQAKKGYSFLKKVIDNTEILIMNKEEAEAVCKKSGIDKCLKDLKKYVLVVVITDGKNGAYAYDGKTKYSICARKVEVVETTGAGDAFASAFLKGYLEKRGNIDFALQMALANSESVIKYVGAKRGLLDYSKIISVMRTDEAKLKHEKL